MPKITEMYAFVMSDVDDDDEGVIAFYDHNTRGWMPMVGADMARIEDLKPIAQVVANERKKEVRLVHLVKDDTITVIQPKIEADGNGEPQ